MSNHSEIQENSKHAIKFKKPSTHTIQYILLHPTRNRQVIKPSRIRVQHKSYSLKTQSACIMLPLLCLWLFAHVAHRLAIQGYWIEWHFPAAFSTTKEDEKHAWGLILDFLIESHDQWSPLSVRITWSGVVLRSKGSPLTIDETIAISSEYLNCLGTMRTWPPAVRREHLIAKPNPLLPQ